MVRLPGWAYPNTGASLTKCSMHAGTRTDNFNCALFEKRKKQTTATRQLSASTGSVGCYRNPLLRYCAGPTAARGGTGENIAFYQLKPTTQRLRFYQTATILSLQRHFSCANGTATSHQADIKQFFLSQLNNACNISKECFVLMDSHM